MLTSQKAIGQCSNIAFDIVLQMDESFVDHFSNTSDPQAAATNAMNSAVAKANTVWNNINSNIWINTVWYAQEVYENDPLYNNNLATWGDNIISNWQSSRTCIKKDVIVYFTGHSSGVNGHTQRQYTGSMCSNAENRGKSCILLFADAGANWNMNRLGVILAHELGHVLGLPHEDALDYYGTSCSTTNCDSVPLLMCKYNSGVGEGLSSCMTEKLNSFFLDNQPGKCDCLEEEYFENQLPEDCARCYPVVTNASTNDIHPVRGCGLDRQKVTVSATILGGCSADNEVMVRAKVKSKYFSVRRDANNAIVSDYFTHSRALPGGIIELIARVNPTDSTSAEKKVPLDFEDSLTVTFDLLFDYEPVSLNDIAAIGGAEVVSINSLNQSVSAWTNAIKPYFDIELGPSRHFTEVVDSGFQYYQIHPQVNSLYRYYHVIGDLDLSYETYFPPFNPDLNLAPPDNYFFIPIEEGTTGQTRYNLNDFHFVLSPGSKVHLEADTDVKLLNCTFEGCEQMWKGIEADNDTYLTMDESVVQDAQYGIRFTGKTLGRVMRSTFRNNNFGIYGAFTPSSGYPYTSLRGNVYDNTAALKTAYTGQSPLPVNQKGYAGIYFDGLPTAVIGELKMGPGAPPILSTFQGMHNGIVLKKSNVTVQGSVFEDIYWSGSSFSAYPVNLAGNGIFCNQGTLIQRGLGYAENSTVSFDNCHAGVRAAHSSIDVSANRMQNVDYGVRSANILPMKYFRVRNNRISATDAGIALHQYMESPAASEVRNNIIQMDNNPNGVGIRIGGNSPTSSHFGGDVADNQINLYEAAKGIEANIANKVNIHNNIVYLEDDAYNYAGIAVNGGNRNAVLCNNTQGLLPKTTGTGGQGGSGFMNIRAYQNMHAPATEWGCNFMEGTGIGMEVAGAADLNDIRGNSFTEANIGLQLGLSPNIGDVFTGPQIHRGNVWEDASLETGAKYLGNADLIGQSKFTVDPSYDLAGITSLYLPNAIDGPEDWFGPDDDDNTTFQCGTQQTGFPSLCLPLNFMPLQLEKTETAIAKGELPGEYYGPAVAWTTRRHLYRRLTEEGNPYSTDPDINDFMTGMDTLAVQAFGAQEIAILAAYAIDSQDSLDLLNMQGRLDDVNVEFILADSLLQDTALISYSDFVKSLPDFATLMEDIDDAVETQRLLIDTLISRRLLWRNPLIDDNDLLPDTTVFQANAKTVNELFVQNFLYYDISLDSTERATLSAIANQCPLAGGEAVLIARAMLDAVVKTPVLYNDALLCEQTETEERRATTTIQEGRYAVAPNPASGLLTLLYVLPKESISSTFVLRNALGEICTKVSLDVQSHSAQISTAHLPNGIYAWEYRDKNTSLASGKLVVIH
ncbi:MAG: M12 family metallo-peptidase [Bacteroidetes bacterium]|nr:M12 family metallo-peptidase [Bacteroidota bacterium]